MNGTYVFIAMALKLKGYSVTKNPNSEGLQQKN